MTELMEISSSNALDVFVAPKGLDPWLEKIATEARSIVPDVSTKKGRDAIASMAFKVAKSKTALDAVGKELVDKLKEQPKLVDAERKRMRDYLDALKDEVRKPLTDWEAAEERRVENHKRAIAHLEAIGNGLINGEPQSFGLLFAELDLIKVDASFQEFEAEAHRVKEAATNKLKAAFDSHRRMEAEKAELAHLRAEAEARARQDREEQIARDAAEKAMREAEAAAAREKEQAEAKAKADREAAERRELELKLAAEQAERQKLAAEQAQKDAEAARIKAEQDAKAQAEQAARDTEARIKREAEQKAAAEAAELAKREADKKHRAKVNNEAAAPFVGIGFTEKQAQDIIKLIVSGKVPHVKIQY